MGAGVKPKLVFVLVLAVSAFTGTARAQATEGTHSPHGNLTIPCQNCHTASAWKPIRAVPEFDHNQTKYPLRGMHTSVACTQCHVKMVFTNVGHQCQDCHADVHRRQLGANCEQCHTVRGWQVANKDIQQHNNRFPLTGAHAAVDCDACHKGGANSQFQTMSTQCFSCHQSDFTSTVNPNHVTAKFSTTCETCHSTDSWLNATFDHSTTGFLLTGGHAVPPRTCTDCHVNNNYNLTSMACISCHQTDFNNATTPVPHTGFPITCEQCHDVVQWTDGKFDHSTTGFTLTGMHTVPPRACTDCHVNNNYTLNSTACVSCHLKDFQGTTNPSHVSLNFSTTCETCHTTSGWSPATFDHNSVNFPLTGAHTVPPRACADCHVNNNYNLTSTTCVSCHLKDFQGTTNPNHVALNFSQTCDTCHNTGAWQPATFDHSLSGFPLTGSHTVPPRACTDCHVNNNYNIQTTTCVSCHQTDYNNATTPVPHTGFPTTCQQCHDTTAWADATFDHSTTGFALTGLHTVPPRACTDCHVNNNYNLTSAACVTCHLKDYQGTTNPNHVSANFPQTCDTCHDTTNWMDATFNHTSTGFPLTGMHTVPPRACTDCHVNNNYSLNSTACVTCHLKDYQGTTNPNHVTANFPQTCDSCHDTTNWMDATFNHSTTGFALTGSHTVPPRLCTDCHVNNNYSLTSTACVTCHQTDYNNATTPVNHVAAAFPLTCDTCHDTVLWTDGTFNHTSTGFTLTGAHVVPPRLCTDCHVNNNYALNSTLCYSCHQADYNGTNNPAHAAAGFPTTCELCHDTTVWTDSTFNHNNTAFPLTGSHTVPPRVCTDCHVNGNYTTLPTTCIGCHQTDYNDTTNPAHSSTINTPFFPTASCSTCHTTTAWTGATFNHTQYTNFSTNHGNAGGVCTTCHIVGSDYSQFQCTVCHGNNNSANFHHPNVNGYVYASPNCYHCHSSGGGG